MAKQPAKKYDKKVGFKGSFEDLVKLTVSPKAVKKPSKPLDKKKE